MIDKRIVYLMLAVVVLATLLAVYGLLGKGKAVPTVHMVMYGNSFNYETEEDFSHEKFWDNYPYWVLLSRNKDIRSNFSLKSIHGAAVTFSDILKSGDSLFFRYQFGSLNDSALNTVLQLILRSNPDVCIITDRAAIPQLESSNSFSMLREHIHTTELMLPLRIDQSALPYFFRIDEYFKAKDIFVPREAIPEVTSRYISELSLKQ